MIETVPPGEIEQRVGVRRHATQHIARAVSAEQRVYILHPVSCRQHLTCPWSQALARHGIDAEGAWKDYQDLAVIVDVTDDGRLLLCGRAQ